MVGVAQSVEHRVVAPGVVGSSPIAHPIEGTNSVFVPFFFVASIQGGTTMTRNAKR